MTLTEFLEQIRDYYLERFREEINEQRENGFETFIEPELLDTSGLVVTEGFFETPYRNDLFVIGKNKPIESIQIDTKSKLSFNPIILQWSDSLTVTVEPFQWNFLTLELTDNNEIDWTPLREWFDDSFKEKDSTTEFKSAVHYISDPYKDDNKIMVDIDLGSATINDFENLLDSLDKMNLTNVIVK